MIGEQTATIGNGRPLATFLLMVFALSLFGFIGLAVAAPFSKWMLPHK